MKSLVCIALLCAVAQSTLAQGGLDLIVSTDEIKVLNGGLYEYKNVQISDRGRLVLKGGTTIAAEKFSSGEGATIEFQGSNKDQESISINTYDASGLKFLYINANGKQGSDTPGTGSNGPDGQNAKSIPFGRESTGGGAGGPGAAGGNGGHAANVSLHLPNLKVGSLLRVHANGGSGGHGQQGGQGGKGGNGAIGHPASNGGSGGVGGKGGSAGNAGRISVYLVVSDEATDQDKDFALKTLRLEYANAAGTPGEGGRGGVGGRGGDGANLGGDGTSGSGGGLGGGAGQGAVGQGPGTVPDQRWTVTNVLTQSQYALQYTQTLQKIHEAMKGK